MAPSHVDRGHSPAFRKEIGGAPPPIAGAQVAGLTAVLHHRLGAAAALENAGDPESIRQAQPGRGGSRNGAGRHACGGATPGSRTTGGGGCSCRPS